VEPDKVEIEWFSIKDCLPLEEYTNQGQFNIIIDVLVHFSDYTEPNEISNVGFAEYCSNGEWRYIGGTPHTYWADKITHWAFFPLAPREFRDK